MGCGESPRRFHLRTEWPADTCLEKDKLYVFFVCLFYFVLFFETGSLCSSGCPGAFCGDEAGLEFTEIFLPLPLKC